jgi:hypothetical protein
MILSESTKNTTAHYLIIFSEESCFSAKSVEGITEIRTINAKNTKL